jgi:DNA replication and repair protein RecF
MRLTHLSLSNFRNFVRLETDLPAGPTLLVGANAQGKTSLLEAIYYLTSTTSPHAGSDRQLVNFLALREPNPFARLVAEVSRLDRLHRIEIRLVQEAPGPGEEPRLRKEILVDGVKRRVRELAGGFNAVMFLPQDLRVIEGAPGDRRRYLDATLSQADPVYSEATAGYARVLSQRNALLKQMQEGSIAARRGNHLNGDQLAFWDGQLADFGATLIRGRALALTELERLAAPIHEGLTQGREALRLDYLPAYDPLPRPQGQLGLPIDASPERTTIPAQAIRQGFLAALEVARTEEIARGMTLLGPHRDDFRLRASGIDLGTYGSRGQNRTAMLTLKLAEVDWMRQRCGEWPVLLLDEVLAELDVERRGALLSRVHAADQAILTSADMQMFSAEFRSRATIWQIVNGTISPLNASRP